MSDEDLEELMALDEETELEELNDPEKTQ